MSVATSVASGMHAALLLARGRPDGMRYVEDDMAGAARSFWAVVVCLPLFVCLRQIDAEADVADQVHQFVLDLLTFVIGWVGFALVSLQVVMAIGRAQRWPRFIVIWNWCNVVQCLIVLAASLPGLLGAPAVLDQTALLVAKCWSLWLEWFAIRLALGISPLAAVGMVALDLGIGIGLAALTSPVQG